MESQRNKSQHVSHNSTTSSPLNTNPAWFVTHSRKSNLFGSTNNSSNQKNLKELQTTFNSKKYFNTNKNRLDHRHHDLNSSPSSMVDQPLKSNRYSYGSYANRNDSLLNSSQLPANNLNNLNVIDSAQQSPVTSRRNIYINSGSSNNSSSIKKICGNKGGSQSCSSKKRLSLFSSSADLFKSQSLSSSTPTASSSPTLSKSASNTSISLVELVLDNQPLLDWLEPKLEALGIDSVIYGRYILSLLLQYNSVESKVNKNSESNSANNSSDQSDDNTTSEPLTLLDSLSKKNVSKLSTAAKANSQQRYCDYHQRLYPGLNCHNSRTKLLNRLDRGSGSLHPNAQKPASTTKFMHRRYVTTNNSNNGSGTRSPVFDFVDYCADEPDYYLEQQSRHCPDCAARAPAFNDYRKIVLTNCLKDVVELDQAVVENFIDDLVEKFDQLNKVSQDSSNNNCTDHKDLDSTVQTMDKSDLPFGSSSGSNSNRLLSRKFISNENGLTLTKLNLSGQNGSNSSPSVKLFQHSRLSEHEAVTRSNSISTASTSSTFGDQSSFPSWSTTRNDFGSTKGHRSNNQQTNKFYHRSLSDESNKEGQNSVASEPSSTKKGGSFFPKSLSSWDDDNNRNATTTTTTSTKTSSSNSKLEESSVRDQAMKYFAAFPALNGDSTQESSNRASSLSSAKSLGSMRSLNKMSTQSSLENDSVFGDSSTSDFSTNMMPTSVSSGNQSDYTARWNGLKIIHNITSKVSHLTARNHHLYFGGSSLASTVASSSGSVNTDSTNSISTVSSNGTSNGSSSSSVVIAGKPPTVPGIIGASSVAGAGKNRLIVAAVPSISPRDAAREESNFMTLKKKSTLSTSSVSSNRNPSITSAVNSSSEEHNDGLQHTNERSTNNKITNTSTANGVNEYHSTVIVSPEHHEKVLNIMPSFLKPTTTEMNSTSTTSSKTAVTGSSIKQSNVINSTQGQSEADRIGVSHDNRSRGLPNQILQQQLSSANMRTSTAISTTYTSSNSTFDVKSLNSNTQQSSISMTATNAVDTTALVDLLPSFLKPSNGGAAAATVDNGIAVSSKPTTHQATTRLSRYIAKSTATCSTVDSTGIASDAFSVSATSACTTATLTSNCEGEKSMFSSKEVPLDVTANNHGHYSCKQTQGVSPTTTTITTATTTTVSDKKATTKATSTVVAGRDECDLTFIHMHSSIVTNIIAGTTVDETPKKTNVTTDILLNKGVTAIDSANITNELSKTTSISHQPKWWTSPKLNSPSSTTTVNSVNIVNTALPSQTSKFAGQIYTSNTNDKHTKTGNDSNVQDLSSTSLINLSKTGYPTSDHRNESEKDTASSMNIISLDRLSVAKTAIGHGQSDWSDDENGGGGGGANVDGDKLNQRILNITSNNQSSWLSNNYWFNYVDSDEKSNATEKSSDILKSKNDVIDDTAQIASAIKPQSNLFANEVISSDNMRTEGDCTTTVAQQPIKLFEMVSPIEPSLSSDLACQEPDSFSATASTTSNNNIGESLKSLSQTSDNSHQYCQQQQPQPLVIDNKESLDQLMNSILMHQRKIELEQQQQQRSLSSSCYPQRSQASQQQQYDFTPSTPSVSSSDMLTKSERHQDSSLNPFSTTSTNGYGNNGTLQRFLDSISSVSPSLSESSSFTTGIESLSCTSSSWHPLSGNNSFGDQSSQKASHSSINSFAHFGLDRVSRFWNQNCTQRLLDFCEADSASVEGPYKPNEFSFDSMDALLAGQVVAPSAVTNGNRSFQHYLDEQRELREEITRMSTVFRESQMRNSSGVHDTVRLGELSLSEALNLNVDLGNSPRNVSLLNHQTESSAFQEVANDYLNETHNSKQNQSLGDISTIVSETFRRNSYHDSNDSACFKPIHSNVDAAIVIEQQQQTPFSRSLSESRAGYRNANRSVQMSTGSISDMTTVANKTNSFPVEKSLTSAPAPVQLGSYASSSLSSTSCSSHKSINIESQHAALFSSPPLQHKKINEPNGLLGNYIGSQEIDNSCDCKNLCDKNFIHSASCCFSGEYYRSNSPQTAVMCDKSTSGERLVEAVNTKLAVAANGDSNVVQCNQRLTNELATLLFSTNRGGTTSAVPVSLVGADDEHDLNFNDLVNDVLRLTIQPDRLLSPLLVEASDTSISQIEPLNNNMIDDVQEQPKFVEENKQSQSIATVTKMGDDEYDGPPMPYSKRKKFQSQNRVYGQFPISNATIQEEQVRLLSLKARQQSRQKSHDVSTLYGDNRQLEEDSITTNSSGRSPSLEANYPGTDQQSVCYQQHYTGLETDQVQDQSLFDCTATDHLVNDDGYGEYSYAEHDFDETADYVTGPDGVQYYVGNEDRAENTDLLQQYSSASMEQLYGAQYGDVHYEPHSSSSVYDILDLKFKSENRAINSTIETVSRQSQKPCTFFMEGFCARGDCKFSHDLSSITCKYWESEGGCLKGDMCPFRHALPDSQILERSKLDPNAKSFQFKIDLEADFPALAGKNEQFGDSDTPLAGSSESGTSVSLQEYFFSNNPDQRMQFRFKPLKQSKQQTSNLYSSSVKQETRTKTKNRSRNNPITSQNQVALSNLDPSFFDGDDNGNKSTDGAGGGNNLEDEWPSLNGYSSSNGVPQSYGGNTGLKSQSQASKLDSYHRINFKEKITKQTNHAKKNNQSNANKFRPNSASASNNKQLKGVF